jgi:hypothetical protein
LAIDQLIAPDLLAAKRCRQVRQRDRGQFPAAGIGDSGATAEARAITATTIEYTMNRMTNICDLRGAP